MKRILLFSLSCFVAASCSSTKTAARKDPAKADVAKYKNTITPADLKTHLYIVAGDEMQGRNTGEPGQKKAGKYLIEEYKSNGISFPKGASDWYQPVPAAYMARAFSPKLNDSENILINIPKHISYFNDISVLKICSGNDHTLFLSKFLKLYGMGSNKVYI